MIVAASPTLRTFARSCEGGIQYILVKSAECFSAIPVDFLIDEVAYSASHLSLCLLDKKCLACSHQGGTRLACNGLDMCCYKSVVCCGCDDCVHGVSV